MENTQVENLKQLINNSPIFEIDKKENLQLYKKELDILAVRIFQLYGKRAQEYGEELYLSILESVKYYNKDKGSFLALFSLNFENKINKTNRAQKYQGIKISDKIYAKARFIYSKLKSSGRNIKDFTIDDVNEICGTILSQRVKETLMEAIMLLYNGDNFVSITTTQNDDEDCISEEFLKDNGVLVGDNVEKNEAINSFLDQIEVFYNTKIRSDTKKMFCIFITRNLLESDISSKCFESKIYFDKWTYEFFVQTKTLPKNIDIAKHEGKMEEKVSSLFKKFKEKLCELKEILKS